MQTQCLQGAITAKEIYEAYQTMGIEYGPAHRGIEQIYLGQGQILAKLVLPASVSGTSDRFVLHPSIMDSALQATLGLVMASGAFRSPGGIALSKPLLPFALQELEVLGGCTSVMWALIRTVNELEPTSARKFDLDLCDEQGMIKIRLKGFTLRELKEEFEISNVSNPISKSFLEPLTGNIMLAPVWDVIRIGQGPIFPAPTERVVIAGGSKNSRDTIRHYYPQAQILEIDDPDPIEIIARKLETQGFINHLIWIAPSNSSKSIAMRYHH